MIATLLATCAGICVLAAGFVPLVIINRRASGAREHDRAYLAAQHCQHGTELISQWQGRR